VQERGRKEGGKRKGRKEEGKGEKGGERETRHTNLSLLPAPLETVAYLVQKICESKCCEI